MAYIRSRADGSELGRSHLALERVNVLWCCMRVLVRCEGLIRWERGRNLRLLNVVFGLKAGKVGLL